MARAINTRSGAENTVGQAFQPASASDFPVRGTVSDAWTEYRTGTPICVASTESGEPADKNVCPTGTPLRVAVVDDDPALHAQVREQLQQTGEPWHVTAYHSGAEALKGLAAALPHVVLLEQTLPDGCGLRCADRLKHQHPQLPVVIHTANGSPEKLFQALTIPALGYVVKHGQPVAWLLHLRKALAGCFTMCDQAERWLPQMLGGLRMAGEQWNLSRRERDVMVCLCRQLPDKEISDQLGISEATVHCHVDRIFKKLNVNSRDSAVQKFTAPLAGGGGVKLPNSAPTGLDLF